MNYTYLLLMLLIDIPWLSKTAHKMTRRKIETIPEKTVAKRCAAGDLVPVKRDDPLVPLVSKLVYKVGSEWFSGVFIAFTEKKIRVHKASGIITIKPNKRHSVLFLNQVYLDITNEEASVLHPLPLPSSSTTIKDAIAERYALFDLFSTPSFDRDFTPFQQFMVKDMIKKCFSSTPDDFLKWYDLTYTQPALLPKVHPRFRIKPLKTPQEICEFLMGIERMYPAEWWLFGGK